MILGYELVDTLIDDEKPDVLGAMVGCAQDIAIELQSKLGVGNGCLDWQLRNNQIAPISALFPTFEVVHKRQGLLHRGNLCLRRCP
jgi:hypothetical protein